MNGEDGIKLQAHLDGELTGRKAQQVAALIENDAEARALFAELQQTNVWLKANEPEMRLPESHEFFWSKIERDIQRLDSAPVEKHSPAWALFFRRHLSAIAGASVATAVIVFAAFQMNVLSPSMFEEIDNPLDDDTGSFSFRSESQKNTLVWIANPFVDAEEAGDGMPMPMPMPGENL